MKKRQLLPVVLVAVATALIVRLGPGAFQSLRRDLAWRTRRLRQGLRAQIEPRVSIAADMGIRNHRAIVWSGLASEAEEVRSKLPAEFGRTWIVPDSGEK